jgi:hypothetical protein
MACYVYILEEQPLDGDASGPWTKIGVSKNPPEWRVDANLKRGNPRTLRVAEVFEYDTEQAAYTAESAAHQASQMFRHQKEWFRIQWQKVVEWLEQTGARRRKH